MVCPLHVFNVHGQGEATMNWKNARPNETVTAKALMTAFLLAATQALAQNASSANASRPKRHVVVSLRQRKLAVLENQKIIRVFPVAVGAKVSPSPAGQFEIVNRITNPTYYRTGRVIPPGDRNPIGTRWVGLSKKGYGIHGTNAPHSIGKAASHGCIRLRNRDVEQLFEMVRLGDTVEITDEPNEQVAQIFGGSTETTAAIGEGVLAGVPATSGQ